MSIVTRRAALGAIGGITAAGLIASTVVTTAEPDTAILAAWEQRRKEVAAINAHPTMEGPSYEAMSDRLDAAEEVIRTATATTARGAMIQIWTSLYYVTSSKEQHDALDRGDFAHFEGDSSLEYHALLAIAAIRSLQAVGASA